jgi:hypothetical protein
MRVALALALSVGACGGHNGSDACDPEKQNCGTDEYCSFIDKKCHPTGDCLGNADCAAGSKCDTTDHLCVGGCGGQPLNIAYVAPNLMVVIDRSSSMNITIAGTNPPTTKWQAAVAGLASVLETYRTSIRWGLTAFPDTYNPSTTTSADCNQMNPIPFLCADGNGGMAGPIATTLTNSLQSTDSFHPGKQGNGTPLYAGLAQAATDPSLDDTTRRSFLMLLSDGQGAGCPDPDPVLTLGQLTQQVVMTLHDTRQVDTFVVGFGAGVNVASLDSLADVGGQAIAVKPASPRYYQANTPMELDQVFQTITRLILTCKYKVDPAPPDPTQTYVFFDKNEPVPYDATQTSGWDYDATTQTVTFYGDYCTRIEDQTLMSVDVVFGCSSPVF